MKQISVDNKTAAIHALLSKNSGYLLDTILANNSGAVAENLLTMFNISTNGQPEQVAEAMKKVVAQQPSAAEHLLNVPIDQTKLSTEAKVALFEQATPEDTVAPQAKSGMGGTWGQNIDLGPTGDSSPASSGSGPGGQTSWLDVINASIPGILGITNTILSGNTGAGGSGADNDPKPKKDTNWMLIGFILFLVALVIFIIYRIARKRK